MLRRKIVLLSNLSLFESETIVIQWSAKVAGRQPQMKPLSMCKNVILIRTP